ncbi:hypothetical protein C8A00DRAFT_17197 [Chaetomidium leptoderma]|uniref:F-box domain-containing protein n=1 Tax=Chaetomidium leptoderma TaxID=669021 RepID=A0AAN6VGZ3_9PEZI|nr:hypothetical protein C8A00DRAFT_17197 [Chaetomidium leptoderma]
MTIDVLPPELLRQIFDSCDGAAPSNDRLNHQPDSDMLRDPNCPLKCISLVSRRWRAIALPLLFRHVVWTLERCDQLVAKPGESEHSDPLNNIPILVFLSTNGLARHVNSFTMIVSHSLDSMVKSLPRKQARSDSPFLEAQAHESSMASSATVYNEDNNWLWHMLFSLVDPLRLTIIASPQTLARLLSCMVFVGDADFSSGERLHILSLSRTSRSNNAPGQLSDPKASSQATLPTARSCPGEQKRARTALFTIRPWTHLLLNENSSIQVYRSYHYFDRVPPSVLSSLLGWEEAPFNVIMIPPTVTSISYIAIFPLMTQFSMLVYHLPRIEHLHLQLVPRNDILLDKQEMAHVQASDLWLERNSCYELVMRHLLSKRHPVTSDDSHDVDGDDDDADSDHHDEDDMTNQRPRPRNHWLFLRKFETGDFADLEAWENAVQLVQMSQTGWRVEREGIFVKEPVSTGVPDVGNMNP